MSKAPCWNEKWWKSETKNRWKKILSIFHFLALNTIELYSFVSKFFGLMSVPPWLQNWLEYHGYSLNFQHDFSWVYFSSNLMKCPHIYIYIYIYIYINQRLRTSQEPSDFWVQWLTHQRWAKASQMVCRPLSCNTDLIMRHICPFLTEI